jgi:hypothetical protein
LGVSIVDTGIGGNAGVFVGLAIVGFLLGVKKPTGLYEETVRPTSAFESA